jgi:class 3 adenylate cyclase
MLDQGNRTFIGSVVFVDIVGYSKQTVSEQISIKDRFTRLLSDVLTDIPPEQRLILDTGDGAALSFLGDPEDALFVSMNMRDLVAKAAAEAGEPPMGTDDAEPPTATRLPLRIGINLGPVKLVRDINGHPNIVGDGINVAQRIMTFARPGQIVVSRSFFDVVSVISEEYAKLFKYEGSRTDKHVREHEIYVVGESVEAFEKARAGTVDRAAATTPNGRPPGVATGTFGIRRDSNLDDSQTMPFLQDRRKLTIAGGVLAAIVLALFLALMLKKPAEKPAEPAVIAKSALPAETPKTETPATTTPNTSQSEPGKTGDGQPAQLALPATGAATPANPAASAGTSPPASGDAKTAAAKLDAAKADAAKQVLVLGTVKFNIDPWGDVSVNGKSIGVSPPMKQTKLPPGKYTIEVKNTSFKPYVTSVEVKPKEDVSIKHKFQ